MKHPYNQLQDALYEYNKRLYATCPLCGEREISTDCNIAKAPYIIHICKQCYDKLLPTPEPPISSSDHCFIQRNLLLMLIVAYGLYGLLYW
jgi:hypothetical protein